MTVCLLIAVLPTHYFGWPALAAGPSTELLVPAFQKGHRYGGISHSSFFQVTKMQQKGVPRTEMRQLYFWCFRFIILARLSVT